MGNFPIIEKYLGHEIPFFGLFLGSCLSSLSGKWVFFLEEKFYHFWFPNLGKNVVVDQGTRKQYFIRTFARTFSNIDFFLKLLPLKVDE